MQNKQAEKNSFNEIINFSNIIKEELNEIKKLQSFIKWTDNSFILDVGSGVGRQINSFPINNLRKVIAFDFSYSAIKVCKKNLSEYDNIFFVVGDAEFMPFKNNIFDDCMCLGVLHHFKDFTEVLREVNRVTKNGSLVYTVDPNAKNPYEKFGINFISKILIKFSFYRNFFKNILVLNENERALDESEIVDSFSKTGFKLKKLEYFFIKCRSFGLYGKIRFIIMNFMKIILPKKYGCNMIRTIFKKYEK